METAEGQVCTGKEGKTGDAAPVVVSSWPLYEVLDFLRESVRHKRLDIVYKSV